MDNYMKLANDNLRRLYESMPGDLKDRLPGEQDGDRYAFTAFGKPCSISPGGLLLDHADPPGVIAILLSLYALHASGEEMILEPFRAFKEFPDSAPYVGAFTSHTELPLVSAVQRIKENRDRVVQELSGESAPPSVSGDFAFVVRPLPKISLCYIVYEADEDFPASVTCLFSNNANLFMPMDGLADVGEYTSKRILEIVAPL